MNTNIGLKVKLAIVVEGGPMPLFSIASTLRCIGLGGFGFMAYQPL